MRSRSMPCFKRNYDPNRYHLNFLENCNFDKRSGLSQ